MDQPLKRRRNGELESLSAEDLAAVFDFAIAIQGSAENALLYLIEHYDFDLDQLKSHLHEKGLQVSLSKVTYHAVAPFVGLELDAGCLDASTFVVNRARIPTFLLKKIVEDIQLMMKQYGPPASHENEEARSRFLAPLFNHCIAQFDLLIVNTPESIMPGYVKTKRCIEYHFKAFGQLTIVFIQVEPDVASGVEILNAIAQVIAEADACDLSNARLGFGSLPVLGILCNGTSFQFFRFDGSTRPPTFSRGVFVKETESGPIETDVLSIANLRATTPLDFIISLRPICEVILSFFLLGYQTGMLAYYQRSVDRGLKSNGVRASKPAWTLAYQLACEAQELAVFAASQAARGDIVSANQTADLASAKLKQSVNAVPASRQRRDWNVMAAWDVERVDRG